VENDRIMLKCKHNTFVVFILTFLFGICVWLTAQYILEINDPQSDARYWHYVYSFLLIISLLLSSITGNILLGPITLISSQLIAELLLTDGDFNQLPIGIAIHFVLLIPCLISSFLGYYIRILVEYGLKKSRRAQ